MPTPGVQPSLAASELCGDQKPSPRSEAGDCPQRTRTPSGHIHHSVLFSLDLPRAQVPLIEENIFLLQAASSRRTQTITECGPFAVARLGRTPGSGSEKTLQGPFRQPSRSGVAGVLAVSRTQSQKRALTTSGSSKR